MEGAEETEQYQAGPASRRAPNVILGNLPATSIVSSETGQQSTRDPRVAASITCMSSKASAPHASREM